MDFALNKCTRAVVIDVVHILQCAEQGLCNGRASVGLSVCRLSAGGFAVERSEGRRYQSTATACCGHRTAGAGAQQQMLRGDEGNYTQTCYYSTY